MSMSSALHAAFNLLATTTTTKSRTEIHVSCRKDGQWVQMCSVDASAAHPRGVLAVAFVQGEEHCAGLGPALVTSGIGEGGGVCVWRIQFTKEAGMASLTMESTLKEWYVATHVHGGIQFALVIGESRERASEPTAPY